MRFRIGLLAAVFLLAACGGAEEETPEAAVSVSDAAPASGTAEATFQDLEGKALEISDFRGSKVFLNYWATWCAPCIREIPSIGRAADELEDEGYVFLLASDEPLATIREFLDEREFEGNFVKLNSFFAEQGVEAVPSSVLFDEKGAVLQTWLGDHEWDSPEMLAELRRAAD